MTAPIGGELEVVTHYTSLSYEIICAVVAKLEVLESRPQLAKVVAVAARLLQSASAVVSGYRRARRAFSVKQLSQQPVNYVASDCWTILRSGPAVVRCT